MIRVAVLHEAFISYRKMNKDHPTAADIRGMLFKLTIAYEFQFVKRADDNYFNIGGEIKQYTEKPYRLQKQFLFCLEDSEPV